MSKKQIWYILPTILLPYLALCVLAVIFFSTEYPVLSFIMETVFCGKVIYLFASLLAWCILAAVLSILGVAVGVRQGWSALSLAKTAMIVKLIQVPAYILTFILGAVLAITLFTIPFAIGLFLLDGLTLILTGLLVAAAAVNAVRQGINKRNEVLPLLMLQLFFCLDVAAAIIFFVRLRNRLANFQN